jgi:membrane-associated protease RseP (regulator of RpoE activity)
MKNFTLLLFFSLSTFLLTAQHNDTALGITSHRIGPHSAEKRNFTFPYGSLIRSIYPESAASQLGLQVFDYIYQIDNQKVNDTLRISEIINQYQVGDEVTVYYERQGKLRSGKAQLSRSSDLDQVHRPSSDDPFLGVSQSHDRLPKGMDGVRVDIVDNSTAQAMGMEDGDLLIQIDDFTLYSWSDLHAAIDNRAVGDAIRLKYYRDGKFYEETRPIKSRAATHNDHSRANGPQIVGKPVPGISGSDVQLLPTTEADQKVVKMEDNPLPIRTNMTFEELNVFPNPSDGIFNIQLELPQRGRTSIQVFDGTGRRVYENNLGDFSGVFSDRIDIANTAKGIYFLLVRQDDKTISKRLILQ